MNVALSVVVLLEFAGLIALGVLLIVSRSKLASTRKELKRRRDGDEQRRRHLSRASADHEIGRCTR